MGTRRTGLSGREMARRLGVAEGVWRKGIRTGRVPAAALARVKGRLVVVDPELAARAWSESADPAKGTPKRGPGKSSHPGLTVAASRQRLLKAQAEKVELDNAERARLLVPAADVRRSSFACARTVRDNLLTLPGRLAAELEGQPRFEIERRLEEELRAALGSLADLLKPEAGAA